MRSKEWARWAPGATVGLMVGAYWLWFAHLTGSIHRGYGDSAFDLGLYDQGVWLLSRFHAPFVTLMGRNLFGDHTQFSLLALVPFYWLRPDATTLLTVQALLLALGAVPVYLLARRRLSNPWWAVALAAAFLVHPALGQSNLENFHPDSFLVPLLGFALYAAIEDKPRMFVAFSILCLLCKEDVALALVPIALWYALLRNRRVGLWIAAGSVGVAFVMAYGVMRSLIGVPTRNAWRIPFSACGTKCGLGRHLRDFVSTVFTDPMRVLRYLRYDNRPFYVWQLLAPTGFVFLVAPEVALTAVVVIAVNVFSTVGFQHQIGFHYSMEILPVLALGTVYAIS
ncbi:MAG TPA: DUF2079 domain-containing protein, partial [Acidimicrobiia bacterium]|nr:DUF2079 domain-containing protein [Acidimicrobiia bacterium]